jgi:hypothetical protein
MECVQNFARQCISAPLYKGKSPIDAALGFACSAGYYKGNNLVHLPYGQNERKVYDIRAGDDLTSSNIFAEREAYGAALNDVRLFTEKFAAIKCSRTIEYGNYSSFGLCVGQAMLISGIGEAAANFGRCYTQVGRNVYAYQHPIKSPV